MRLVIFTLVTLLLSPSFILLARIDHLPSTPLDIAVQGPYAYVGWGDSSTFQFHGGLLVVDLQDVANPRIVGRYTGPGLFADVASSGKYVYVVVKRYVQQAWHDLLVLDVSDPSAPQAVTTYSRIARRGASLAVEGDYLFLAAGVNGLRVFDISEPAQPREVSFFQIEVPNSRAVRVVADAQRAYLLSRIPYAYPPFKVSILDVATPTQLVSLGEIPLAGNYITLAVQQHRLYVTTASSVGVLDVTDPTNIRSLWTWGFADDSVQGVYPVDEKSFLLWHLNGTELWVRRGANLRRVGRFEAGGPLVLQHNRVYLLSFRTLYLLQLMRFQQYLPLIHRS